MNWCNCSNRQHSRYRANSLLIVQSFSVKLKAAFKESSGNEISAHWAELCSCNAARNTILTLSNFSPDIWEVEQLH